MAIGFEQVREEGRFSHIFGAHQFEGTVHEVELLAEQSDLAFALFGSLHDAEPLAFEGIPLASILFGGCILHQLGLPYRGIGLTTIDGQADLEHRHPHVLAVHVCHPWHLGLLVEHILCPNAQHGAPHVAHLPFGLLEGILLVADGCQFRTCVLDVVHRDDGHLAQHDAVGSDDVAVSLAMHQQVELLLLERELGLGRLKLFLEAQFLCLETQLVAHVGLHPAVRRRLVLIERGFLDLLQERDILPEGGYLLLCRKYLIPFFLHLIGKVDAFHAVHLVRLFHLPLLLSASSLHRTGPGEHLHQSEGGHLSAVDQFHGAGIPVHRQFRITDGAGWADGFERSLVALQCRFGPRTVLYGRHHVRIQTIRLLFRRNPALHCNKY